MFGPRGTGKSTYLTQALPEDTTYKIDLLLPETFDRFLGNKNELINQITALDPKYEWILIDEVQKLPQLLDSVHYLIEKTKFKFALTGSSARKLKKGAANLLAGRAFMYNLFPLTALELEGEFDLDRILTFGSLPKIFSLVNDDDRALFLEAYARTYLKEEIWDEHIIRALPPFKKFLEVSAQANGEIINYSNIAADVGADDKTVKAYFEILEDTLVGFMLEPFNRSVRKRQRQSPKFYYFDTGVKRALAGQTLSIIKSGDYGYGKTFEHWLISEIHRLNSYYRKNYKFSYLRVNDNAEIDLIIETPEHKIFAIEIKSTKVIRDDDVSVLNALGADIKLAELLCLSNDLVSKKIGNSLCLHWQDGLKKILDLA